MLVTVAELVPGVVLAPVLVQPQTRQLLGYQVEVVHPSKQAAVLAGQSSGQPCHTFVLVAG